MPFSVAIEHKMLLVFKLFRSKAHQLSFGYSSKYLLTKLAREHHQLHNDIVNNCVQIINERKKSGRKPDKNLIDMMLEWNEKCDQKGGNPAEKYSLHQMIGLLIFFYTAGTDTSRATLTSLVYMLGQQKEARQLVEQELLGTILGGSWSKVNEIGNTDLDWEKCSLLSQFIKESQRMAGILGVFFYRTCTKNHKLGKINMKKGTIVNFPGMFIHYNQKYFTNPEKFDLERFSKENS